MARINGALKAGASAALALSLASVAAAQPSSPTARASALKALTDCRALTDGTARLACFDAAAARLEQAEQAGEVVVLDRAQVRSAKRDAFGFSLPSFNLFDRTASQRAEEVDAITLTVASAGRDGAGKWIVTMQGGQVWRQTDTESVRIRTGSKAQIRRAALGSFFMNIDGQRAVRARRDR